MGNIIVLDELTANKIAAGEVIERPASVVKEMVENSIDAGADQIQIEVKRGGITYIRISDNGSGIMPDDAVIAFEKHATSKITSANDLEAINTLGFRGEALASIAAVSNVELTTKTENAPYGTRVRFSGGAFIDSAECGCSKGTTIVVKDLFFNTPARFKFLKKDATEASHVIDLIERMALAHPEIAFKLINNGSEVIRTPGDGDLLSVIYSIYGKDIAKRVKKINFTDKGIKVTGYAGDISTGSSSRGRQSLFINGRYVKSRVVTAAIDESYKTLMMKNKYPFIILHLEINPINVDVNVHPTKMEVRFSEEQFIFKSIYSAISNALFSRGEEAVKEDIENETRKKEESIFTKKNNFIFEHTRTSEKKYEQGNLTDLNVKEDLKTDDYKATETKNKAPIYVQSEPAAEKEEIVLNVQRTDIYDNEMKPQKKPEAFVSDVKFKRSAEETGIKKSETSEAGKLNIYDSAAVHDAETLGILRESIYIGQIFDTYIILQYKEDIIYLDQHAAHERVLFEELKTRYSRREIISQNLLTPIVVELTKSESEIYSKNKGIFETIGFTIDEFGTDAVAVRAIPDLLETGDVKPVIIETLRGIIEDSQTGVTVINEDILHTMACKAAIKANHKIDALEVKALLDRMTKLENPFTCPHGRPITFKMSKREIEKKFKRVL